MKVNYDGFSQTDLTSSEANTKKRIIEPLLEILGWNLVSNEVQLEYAVKVGTTAHVDYALLLEGKTVFLVEAKAFDVVLSDDHSSQIISKHLLRSVETHMTGEMPNSLNVAPHRVLRNPFVHQQFWISESLHLVIAYRAQTATASSFKKILSPREI